MFLYLCNQLQSLFKMVKLKTLIFFLLFGLSNNLIAQSSISNEIGVIAGPLEFRSDYGQSDNAKTNFNNSGFGIGLVHYLTFSYRNDFSRFFGEHFRIRNELSYSKTDLKHYGKWVDNNSNSTGTKQLRAMYGSTQLVNLGTQLEYSLSDIHDFERSSNVFNPYVSLGAQISYYNAKATSTLGELGNPISTFSKYLVPSDGHPYGFSNESKTVISAVASVGTRYKLTPLTDLLFDVRLQYFNSDWVDGLNPNKDIYTENKANDWLVWVTLGYIYYLDK